MPQKGIVMAQKVAGDLYETLTGQLFELGRQLRQPNGYPFDPHRLKRNLQAAIEGRFGHSVLKRLDAVAKLSWANFSFKENFEGSSVRFNSCFKAYLWEAHESYIPTDGLVISELTHESPDTVILGELGGLATVPLVYIGHHLLLQWSGDCRTYDGLSTRTLNVFFHRTPAQLFTIHVNWHTRHQHWDVDAYEVSPANPSMYNAGCRIFHR